LILYKFLLVFFVVVVVVVVVCLYQQEQNISYLEAVTITDDRMHI
jgi:hypothetical protein